LFAVGTVSAPSSVPVVDAGSSFQKIDASMAAKMLDYALLSQCIYDLGTDKFHAPTGWEAVALPGFVCLANPKRAAVEDQVNGFKASAFVKGRQIAVVFQGTNPNEITDWSTDIAAKMGLEPGQYKDAIVYAEQVVQEAGSNYDVVFTGHSLGGGLATFAALHCGKTAYVFNAAPLGSLMTADIKDIGKNRALITNIDMTGDVVSGFGGQTGSIYILNIPPVTRAYLGAELKAIQDAQHGFPFIRNLKELGAQAAFTADSILQLHSMDTIVQALRL
jgi:hypothetical protein